MNRTLPIIGAASVIIFMLINLRTESNDNHEQRSEPAKTGITLNGAFQPGETLERIFNTLNLDLADLSEIVASSKGVHNLSMISVGSLYSFEIDKEEKHIKQMRLVIDDVSFLDIIRDTEGFISRKVTLPVTKKTGSLYIHIDDNLANAMPSNHKEYHKLTLKLSDIYAWDIDFSSDIRSGDSVKIVIEELWVGEVFKGYGEILAAEFVNNGKMHAAYRFENQGYADYYDTKGKSLKKALLRSPLRFKYISSGFSKRRFHPALRIYRPHLGVDYAAPTGTPVSAAGSGEVMFSGYKGQNGRMVKIRHRGGYITYYGHLSKIPKKIRKGAKVSQGDIIGYVGTTGLSTGPHLDYRIKFNGKFVNPLKIKLPRGTSVPKKLMTDFRKVVESFDSRLASIDQPVMASRVKSKTSG
ncbi:MAG: peptidoglycan DD-metalloendopeptidase family protein [Nitrospiraceae bacterium]|nr:MAG: peptidoglycan DD-metalloendopeptidase family protein [Nitrospiraceae bacterium]